jgi:hypothetical protein
VKFTSVNGVNAAPAIAVWLEGVVGERLTATLPTGTFVLMAPVEVTPVEVVPVEVIPVPVVVVPVPNKLERSRPRPPPLEVEPEEVSLAAVARPAAIAATLNASHE